MLVMSDFLCTFAGGKHCHGAVAGAPSGHERKVRAAQDAPLAKIQAVGDGWIRQKRRTARLRLENERLTMENG